TGTATSAPPRGIAAATHSVGTRGDSARVTPTVETKPIQMASASRAPATAPVHFPATDARLTTSAGPTAILTENVLPPRAVIAARYPAGRSTTCAAQGLEETER